MGQALALARRVHVKKSTNTLRFLIPETMQGQRNTPPCDSLSSQRPWMENEAAQALRPDGESAQRPYKLA
jgi:hypothetical protein